METVERYNGKRNEQNKMPNYEINGWRIDAETLLLIWADEKEGTPVATSLPEVRYK